MSSNLSSKTIVNSDGYEVYVENDSALPATSAGLLIAGSDGSNVKYISLDISGNQLLAGAGTAGTPDGGVLSIQGVSSAFSLDITGQVDVGTVNNPVEIIQATASNLLASVGGLGAAGAAISGNPMRLGGSDGSNTTDILTDSAGRLAYVGAADDGAALAGNPVRIGASDGSLTKDILSDDSGRLISVGAADAGSAVAGAPVLMGSSDDSEGNFMQVFMTDSEGRLMRVGGSANSNVALHNPLRLGGSDGSLTTDILTDADGYLLMAGPDAAGSAPTANPVLLAGWDGTNVQILKTDAFGAIEVNDVKATESTLSSANASTSSATLLASNPDRQGGLIFNNSYYPCYLKLGAHASTSDFTTRLGAYAYYELPAGYTGVVSVVWNNAAANGSAMATELGAGGGGGGGGGGGSRPLVDANHIHVWNCDDQVGSSILVDSVGGKDLTLQGSAGTNYSLNQIAGGSPYPYARGLLDGTSTPLAINTDFSMSVSQVTYECVVRFSAVPTSTSRSLMTLETVGGGPLDYVYMEYIQYDSYVSKIYGAVYNDGPYPSGNFTSTTITNYDAPDFAIAADTTYYVMWTYDSSNGEQKIYINGVLKNTTSGISPTLTNLTKFTLGSASGNRSFQGYIRDVRISNVVRDSSYAAAAAAALTT